MLQPSRPLGPKWSWQSISRHASALPRTTVIMAMTMTLPSSADTVSQGGLRYRAQAAPMQGRRAMMRAQSRLRQRQKRVSGSVA